MSNEPPRIEYASPGTSEPPPRGALGIIFLIVFIDLLGFGIIIPQLPFYATAFDASPLQVTVLFSVYSICQFIGAPLLGAWSDRHGRRPVLVLSQIGSALGYVLLGVVMDLQWESVGLALGLVYLSRVIDGFSGGNISTAQAYVSDVTTPANRAKGMGVIGAAFGVGFAAGPAIGGILGEIDVAWPAYAAALLCVVATVLTYLRLPESRRHERSVAAAWWNPRSFAPAFRKPVLAQLVLIGFISMGAFVMMESCIALFLAEPETFGYGSAEVGWFFAFAGVIIVIVQGGLIGRLTRRIGEWPLAIAGPVLVTAGMGVFIATGYVPALGLLLAGGALNSVGRSLQTPTLTSLISKYGDEREQGVVFGVYQSMSAVARVIGPVVAGVAYTAHFTAPFGIAAGVLLVAALWTVLLRAGGGAAAPAATAG